MQMLFWYVNKFLVADYAEVAELVDAHGLGPCSLLLGVEVQVLSSALKISKILLFTIILY